MLPFQWSQMQTFQEAFANQRKQKYLTTPHQSLKKRFSSGAEQKLSYHKLIYKFLQVINICSLYRKE